MQNDNGLTSKDQSWINTKCRSIAKLERHGVKERFLRHELYMLGVYAFRKFHHTDLPTDPLQPGLCNEHTNKN